MKKIIVIILGGVNNLFARSPTIAPKIRMLLLKKAVKLFR